MQWLGSGDNLLLSESSGIILDVTTMVNSSAFSRTLRFTPVWTSHGGLYTCQAMADSVMVTKAINVTVQSKCWVRMLVDYINESSSECLQFIQLEIRVHTHLTILNHADYNPSAAQTNCVASFRFTSELEVHLPTEVTSVSK